MWFELQKRPDRLSFTACASFIPCRVVSGERNTHRTIASQSSAPFKLHYLHTSPSNTLLHASHGAVYISPLSAACWAALR